GYSHADCRTDIVFRFLPIKFTAGVIGDPNPVKDGKNRDEHPEGRLSNKIAAGNVDRHDDRTHNNDGVQERQRRPDLDYAYTQNIQLASEVAQHSPGSDSDCIADREYQQRKRQRNVESISQAREYVAGSIIRSKNMIARRAMRRRSRKIQQGLG